MAYGDISVLRTTVRALRLSKDNWKLHVGYMPGKVVIAVAYRSGVRIYGTDCPIPIDEIDGVIERLQRAKADAKKRRN